MKLFKVSLLSIVLTLAGFMTVKAQAPLEIEPVSSTEGYEFFVAFLPNSDKMPDAADLKLQLLISSFPVEGHPEIKENIVGIEYGTETTEEKVAVGQTKVVDIKPKQAFWDISKNEVEKPLDKGVHIYSKNNVKMTVYSINQSGSDKAKFTLDGAHALPKQALGHEYIVACEAEDKMATEFVVMSTAPGKTTATITLPNGIKTSSGKATLTASFTKPYQIYIVRSQVADPNKPDNIIDLSGSTVCSDQPVAVWSGNQAASFPTRLGGASDDHTYDQLLPIDRWGKQFIVPLTGLRMRVNEVKVLAREDGTNVTITRADGGSESKTLASKDKWPYLIEAELGANLENSTLTIDANKPVEVFLYTSSAIYNLQIEGGKEKYQGDPSMTMIAPIEYATNRTIFSTHKNPVEGEGIEPMQYEMAIWAKNSTISSLKLDGTAVQAGQFKALTGAFSGYKFARIPLKDGTHTLTANEKGFGGYVYGLEDGQACLFPLGYDFKPSEDSLFLSKKYEPIAVLTSEFNAKYPDNGGGWYLDRVTLPKDPVRMDTIFICDSTTLRFPTKVHNKWDECKWEIMRINPTNKKRTEYTDNKDKRKEEVLPAATNPSLEAMFTVLPEKGTPSNKRHAFEDFEVRLVLYRQPLMCPGGDKEKWQKDTLSTIVRAYRSYNDTVYMIKCDNDKPIDNLIVDPVTGTKTVFNCNPASPVAGAVQLNYGENGPYKYVYNTANGCKNDSIVTVNILLCKSDTKTRDEDWICESLLQETIDELGDFFKNVDFDATLQECKQKKTTIKGEGWQWTWSNNYNYATFSGTSTVRTTDCNPKMEEWHNKYGVAYPRGVPGCDNSLTVKINVYPMETHYYTARSCNKSGYKWEWGGFGTDTKTTETIPFQKGSHTIVREGKKQGSPYGSFPKNTCLNHKYILNIEFYEDGATLTKDIVMCNDDKPMNIKDAQTDDPNYKWVFNPRDYTPGTYTNPDGAVPATNEEGCNFKLMFRVTVNPVTIHHDTIVYCYDDGSNIEFEWLGHPRFWANLKGDKKKNYFNNKLLTFRRPKAPSKPDYKDTRIIYELSDTVIHTGENECHELYYLTLIAIPPYTFANSSRQDPISTEEWFEWADVIWTGDKADVSAIPNPKNLDVITLHQGTYTQGDWSIQYIAGNYEYVITRPNQQTHAYHREDGSMTLTCDSSIQLSVQIDDVYYEQGYAYTCSNKEYTWVAGDTAIEVDLSKYYTDLKELPKTISLPQQHRKTVKPRVVLGIDAYYDMDLTIFPGYSTPYESLACQSPGEKVRFQDIDFPLDVADTLYGGNKLETKPRQWYNPGTEQYTEVKCDSGEVVTMIVHPVYNETLNTEQSTYERTLRSHDTLTFFDNPKILFVGDRYLEAHPGATLEQLAADAHVSMANVKVVEGTDPELGKEVIYEFQADKSREKNAQQCDSITYLNLTFIKTKVTTLPDMHMGDNGTTHWSFGGDTSSVHGSIHTQAYIDESYFQYYYDLAHDTIGEVNFADTTTDGRIRKVDYFSDEEGVRTFTFEDRMLTKDGVDSIIIQTVTIYPTYDIVVDSAEVCASDTYHWVSSNGEIDEMVDVSAVAAEHDNRVVYVPKVLCVKRFQNRQDAEGNYLCIDSICRLKLTVFGKKNIPVTHNHCFNDPTYKWGGYDIKYDPEAYISGEITDTIFPKSSTEEAKKCYDVLKMTVNFHPVYGVDAYKYSEIYLDPFIQDTVICEGEENFHWIDKNGNDHTFSNYLYDQDGKKLENTTKINLDILNTELIIYDSLKTVNGCLCDSVYTLRYKVREAFKPKHDTLRICKGEDPVETDHVFNWTSTIKETRYYTINEAKDICDTLIRPDIVIIDGKEVRGCDSIYYLHILVDPIYDQFIDTTLCYDDAPFEWGGIDYTPDLIDSRNWLEGKTYDPVTQHLKTTRNGCDSTVTLQLTISPSKRVPIDTTVCIGEEYDFFGEIFTVDNQPPADYSKAISNPGSKCKSEYVLNLSFLPPTQFEVQADPVCFGDAHKDGYYILRYRYLKTKQNPNPVPPVSYSIYYDQKAQDSVGLEDQIDIPIPHTGQSQAAGEYYDLEIPLPTLDKREDYPTPGIYDAVIGFKNGICGGDSLMRVAFKVKVQYPSWIMEARHGDVIVIRKDSTRTWDQFQWYKNNQKIEGEVQPYLYVPDGLELGATYHVVLTQLSAEGDTINSSPACDILITESHLNQLHNDDTSHEPTSDYVSVVPTCVPLGKTTIHILGRNSSSSGNYRISNSEGQFISKGNYSGRSTQVAIPAVAGLYIVQIWNDNKDSDESYRAVKVLVNDVCPDCSDISSF